MQLIVLLFLLHSHAHTNEQIFEPRKSLLVEKFQIGSLCLLASNVIYVQKNTSQCYSPCEYVADVAGMYTYERARLTKYALQT